MIGAPRGLAARDPDRLLAFLGTSHRDQRVLCDQLEAIADSLPEQVDRALCLYAARALGPLIAHAQALEEEVLFPALESRWRGLPGMARTLERLRLEHCEDACFAEELFDALMAYGRGVPDPAPETFGYMLRGFFEGLRRHIAFEEEVVVPLFGLVARRGRDG